MPHLSRFVVDSCSIAGMMMNQYKHGIQTGVSLTANRLTPAWCSFLKINLDKYK